MEKLKKIKFAFVVGIYDDFFPDLGSCVFAATITDISGKFFELFLKISNIFIKNFMKNKYIYDLLLINVPEIVKISKFIKDD
jgi:hypothetical protein